MKRFHAGVDIGSTTVKIVITSDDSDILFSRYRRHHAHTQGALAQLLQEAKDELGDSSHHRFRLDGLI